MIGQVHLLVYYNYKAEKPSVCPSAFFPRHADNLVISAWINSGFGLCDCGVFWHEQVCFYKSVGALCWAHECLKGTDVAPFCLA